jgi:hypothetical protein
MGGPLEGDSNTAQVAVYGHNTDAGNGVIGESQLAEGVRGVSHNPYHGGVVGVSDQNGGVGVFGTCDDGKGGVVGTGVWGKSRNWGVLGESQDYEGVRGISHNPNHGGVVGICDKANGTGVYGFCDDGSKNLPGTGVFGESSLGEGVHGETNSLTTAAVAGIMLNPQGTGAGVYAESRGKGPAGWFQGNVTITGNLDHRGSATVVGTVTAHDVVLSNSDCAEDFDVTGEPEVGPGTVMVIDRESGLRQSNQAYDKKVAGVVSGGGDFKPGIVLGKRASPARRMPIALVGKSLLQGGRQLFSHRDWGLADDFPDGWSCYESHKSPDGSRVSYRKGVTWPRRGPGAYSHLGRLAVTD